MPNCLTTPPKKRVFNKEMGCASHPHLHALLALCLMLWALQTGKQAAAQPLMARGLARPPELITLTQNTPFDQALRVIQTFSNRPVIDTRHLKDPIGLDIDRQPWPWALVEIARNHGMYVVEHENYYELLPENAGQKKDAAPNNPDATADSREVNISAVFFQADLKAIRELGIDWTTLNNGRVTVQSDLKGAQQVSNDIFSIGTHAKISEKMSVDALLKTFEANNTGEVIANPQIQVQNEKEGHIQVGSDFSITTSDFSGNAITQFFSTGTILTVTPHIFTDNDIDFVDLKVEAERSSLVDPDRNLISKTLAKTSTLLRDGEQTAIGGLYGREVSESRTGIPLLKDIPGWFLGLGYLFGHNAKQVTKTELIVLLKVNIVPSVRQRAKLNEKQNASDIIWDRKKTFEDMLDHLNKAHVDSLKK